MPRILVVDDHAVFRKRVVQAVAESVLGADVDEAEDGRKALALAETGGYALVVLDISLPDRGGLEVLKEIRSRRPDTRVLVLSMHPEEEYVVRAFRAGASGYMTKEGAAAEIAGAVRTMLAGGRYVSPSLAEKLSGERESANDEPLPKRSDGR